MKPLQNKGKTAIIALLGITLSAACNHTAPPAPRVVLQEVRVPVAVSCVPADAPQSQPGRIVIPADAEPGQVMLLITQELVARRGYDDQVSVVILACRNVR